MHCPSFDPNRNPCNTLYQTLRRLHGPSSRDLTMASLWSYCDESGTHTGAAHTVVAGLLADGRTWDGFNDAWCESLAQEGLTCFHMTDCENGQRNFSHLSEQARRPERDRLQRKFISLINAFNLRGYAVGVSRDGYDAQVQALQFHVGEKKYAFPYLFCFEECVGGICGLASEYPRDEQISFMFDRNTEYQGRAGEIFAIISNYKELSYGYRLGGIAFYDKTKHPGLQAADILAYEAC
jgi:uncharacterized protein DUF3800